LSSWRRALEGITDDEMVALANRVATDAHLFSDLHNSGARIDGKAPAALSS